MSLSSRDLAYEDLRLAADYLRKYATAIEDQLYMRMTVGEARNEIDEADRLAYELETLADELDTIYPPSSVPSDRDTQKDVE